MNNQNKKYIFDFDSTFIQVETLDVLAEICFQHNPDKDKLTAEIAKMTKLTMEGYYSFAESLKERFNLIRPNKAQIKEVIAILKQKITPSIFRNREFFKKNADSIYIISGGFTEIILPIVHDFGIKPSHILANRMLYDFEGNIYGYDQENPLAQDQGKVKALSQIKLSGESVIIGDGYTDYEVKEAGLADTFVAFTENVSRDKVVEKADIVVNDLEGLFLTYHLPYLHASSAKKVLLLENIHPVVVQHFRNLGYAVESHKNAMDETTLLDKIQDIHILGIRSKTEVTARIIQNAKQLESVGAFCIGTNQIDLNACSHQGVAVFNAPYSNTRSVVELAVAEIIMLVRRAASMNNLMLKGQWLKSSTGAHEVRGKTLGIIGYGHIGAQLSIIAEALGMQIIFYDIEDKLALGNAKPCSSLQACLAQSDVVSIHVDGRKENKNLIGQAEFEQMKDGVMFLNLSRGFVVDYDALIHNLKSGKVAGAGLDVFPEEPHDSKASFSSVFQQFDNVILTPHIGGSTEEAQQNIGEYVSKNLHAYVNDGTTVSSVNFPPLYLPTLYFPQRIIHIHKNVPGVLAKINSLFAQHEINIEGQFLKTNDEMGYVITDVNHEIEPAVLEQLGKIPQTIKVRLLNKYL